MATFGMTRKTGWTYDETLARLPELLKAEGFGVLTEIDVKETLKKKIGVDFRRYKILGACNPPLAHEALSREVTAGVMLPCNVVVYEDDDGKVNLVAADPAQIVSAVGAEALKPMAVAVREKLARVLAQAG